MVDTNSGKSDDQNINARELEKRKSEATSDETLSDIRENESDLDSTEDPNPAPSPDGAIDESDENKNAGPM